MCIIIDANTLSTVFDSTNKEHNKFRPVLEWIVSNKGKMVYGGSHYKKELSKLTTYLRFIRQLKDAGKIFEPDQTQVDSMYEIIKQKSSSKQFNDPQIMAIISVCGCKLLCSGDKKSFKYVKDKELYLNGQKPPSIFSGNKSNIKLLRDSNIAGCCLPCQKGSKELQEYFKS
jgi:hypothetical protein